MHDDEPFINNSNLIKTRTYDNCIIDSSTLENCEVSGSSWICGSNLKNLVIADRMELCNVTVDRQSQIYFNYIPARTGTYPCTLVWQKDGVHFEWGCRGGKNILGYIKEEGDYPEDTVFLFETLVKMLDDVNA
tara:strand:+ start:685 stop:1083 length:399 start_codon:yes stop_codon:yes gene_type:complete